MNIIAAHQVLALQGNLSSSRLLDQQDPSSADRAHGLLNGTSSVLPRRKRCITKCWRTGQGCGPLSLLFLIQVVQLEIGDPILLPRNALDPVFVLVGMLFIFGKLTSR